MTAGQLMSDVILGVNFLNELEVMMDFKNKCLVTNVNGVASSHDFLYDVVVRESTGLEPASSQSTKFIVHKLQPQGNHEELIQ
jgi:hypothetical protein